MLLLFWSKAIHICIWTFLIWLLSNEILLWFIDWVIIGIWNETFSSYLCSFSVFKTSGIPRQRASSIMNEKKKKQIAKTNLRCPPKIMLAVYDSLCFIIIFRSGFACEFSQNLFGHFEPSCCQQQSYKIIDCQRNLECISNCKVRTLLNDGQPSLSAGGSAGRAHGVGTWRNTFIVAHSLCNGGSGIIQRATEIQQLNNDSNNDYIYYDKTTLHCVGAA